MSRPWPIDIFAALLFGLGIAHGVANAQGSRTDYERADGLREMTENKVFKATMSNT